MRKSVTTPGRSHSFLASRRCGQVESMRPVVLATPVSSAMPSAGASAVSASVSGPPKPARPPVAATPAVFTCTTSRVAGRTNAWTCSKVTQPHSSRLQRVSPIAQRSTRSASRHGSGTTRPSSTSRYVPAATCHATTPALLCSRTHRTVSVQMWMEETKSSFEMAKAKIDGREISYPYLLDAKGEPRLVSTNAFMIWYCVEIRCSVVVLAGVRGRLR